MCRKWLLIQRDHPFKPESGNSIPNGFLQIFFTVWDVEYGHLTVCV